MYKFSVQSSRGRQFCQFKYSDSDGMQVNTLADVGGSLNGQIALVQKYKSYTDRQKTKTKKDPSAAWQHLMGRVAIAQAIVKLIGGNSRRY